MKYLVDLDGTLLLENGPAVGAVAFVAELVRRNCDFRVMTNSIRSPRAISERLQNAGMAIPETRILNPIAAINGFLSDCGIRSAWIVGSAAEVAQVNAAQETEHPELLILLDFEKENCAYAELQRVFALLQRGVPAIAASGSPWYLRDGHKRLDTGAFVRLLESATGMPIRIFGKPSGEYFAEGIRALGGSAQDITVVGDDWSTDIAGGSHARCRTTLVATGKYRAGDEARCPPDRLVATLAELL
jgi:HAD superfamily hydrolase (TIGR01450 family)